MFSTIFHIVFDSDFTFHYEIDFYDEERELKNLLGFKYCSGVKKMMKAQKRSLQGKEVEVRNTIWIEILQEK